MKKENDPINPKNRNQGNSPDASRENQDHEFPGYPHYPPQQDIIEGDSGAERADINLDNFSRNTAPVARKENTREIFSEDFSDNPDTNGSDADVTREDLEGLGDPNRDQDGGDDESMENYQGLDDTDFDGEPLNEHAGTLAATGRDLDLPDPEMDLNDMDGQEDEENDYYSLGGDGKEELEEEQPDNV